MTPAYYGKFIADVAAKVAPAVEVVSSGRQRGRQERHPPRSFCQFLAGNTPR